MVVATKALYLQIERCVSLALHTVEVKSEAQDETKTKRNVSCLVLKPCTPLLANVCSTVGAHVRAFDTQQNSGMRERSARHPVL